VGFSGEQIQIMIWFKSRFCGHIGSQSLCNYICHWDYCAYVTRCNGSRLEARPTVLRPRHIALTPRRDWDETLVCLETVSRLRCLDRDHIPAVQCATLFHLVVLSLTIVL